MATALVLFCCMFSALGSFLFGYDSGIISSSIAQEDFLNRFGSNGKIADSVTGGIVSSYTGGAILGSLATSYLSDRYGRRVAIFVGSLLAAFGGALQGGARGLVMVIAGRFIAGLAVGLLSATIPNYCSEVAPPNIRGLLGGMQQWMLGLGYVFAQWIGYGCSRTSSAFSWRFPLGFQVIPALILAAGILFLPESPRWLLEHGEPSLARSALEKLHLDTNGSNRDFVHLEFMEIRDAISAEKSACAEVPWKLLITRASYRRRVLLGCGIQLFTQTSGINVINYYGPRIYATLGFSTTRSLFIIGIYGALAQVYNTICLAIMDRIGRKKLLIPSMVGMGAALCTNATLAHYFNPDTSHNANALRASVAMNFVFSVFFTSVGVISWVYPAEIFPMAIRARGTSLSTFTNWASNLVFAQCSPIALSQMGYRYFYVFMAFNWIAAVLIYLFYPETLGRTLEQLDELFGDNLVAHALQESPQPPRTAKLEGWAEVSSDKNSP